MTVRKSGGAKENVRRGFWVTILLLMMTMALAACGKSDEVTFRDPLVERCVREELGKTATDAVTKSECAKLKELTITSTKDVGLELNLLRLDVGIQNFVDLSDLQYFTGLRELTIVPFDERLEYADSYVGWSAIKACKDLRKLTISVGKTYVEEKLGYKFLADVLKELPKLETLELGYEVPERYQTYLKGENKELTIDCEAEVEDAITYWVPIAIGMRDLEELTGDEEDVIIRFEPGVEVDLSYFADFKNLKTLTLWGSITYDAGELRKYEKDQLFHIKNVDALKDNKELFALNVSGAYGDFDGIGELSQLKELSIVQCLVGEPEFLKKLPELRELTFRLNYADEFPDYVTEKNLPNLAFLRANVMEFDDLSDVAKMKKLKMLSLKQAIGVTYRDEESVPTSEIAKCANLKYLELEQRNGASLKPLEQLKNLEYLYVRSVERMTGLSSLMELPNLYGVYVVTSNMDPSEEDNKELVKASKNPTLSVFINSQYTDQIGVLKMRLGKIAVRDFALERLEGFKACAEANVYTEGYDTLLFYFGAESAEELEKLLEQ